MRRYHIFFPAPDWLYCQEIARLRPKGIRESVIVLGKTAFVSPLSIKAILSSGVMLDRWLSCNKGHIARRRELGMSKLGGNLLWGGGECGGECVCVGGC